jgi:hypothetical protein
MYIASLSRWSGKRETVVANAKKAKAIIEKSGGNVRLSQIHTGPNAGQFMAAVRYPDWQTYGKAQMALAEDATYQKIMTDALTVTPMEDRAIVIGVDV